jgi:hypothetical protein
MNSCGIISKTKKNKKIIAKKYCLLLFLFFYNT